MHTDDIMRVSARTGLGLKYISKDIFITTLLKELEGLLGDECVLKGGTAITRAGHLDAPRFSEDVDLDVYSTFDKRGLATEFSSVLDELDPFKVARPRIHKVFVRFDATFINHFDEKDRIKIKLVPRSPSLYDKSRIERTSLQSPFTIGQIAVLSIYSRERLFAMKVAALAGRHDGKDPFDLRGMWHNGVNVEEVLMAIGIVAKAEEKNPKDLVEEAMSSLDWMMGDVKTIMNTTNHFVPRNIRSDWKGILQEVKTILTRLSDVRGKI